MTTLSSNQSNSLRCDAPLQSTTGVTVSRWFVLSIQHLMATAATRYKQRLDRQAFDNLLDLDEHMLKDIGVTKQDVTWASNLPVSQDAATELEIIARRR